MITKRTGQGFTSCRGCTKKGKYSRTWDFCLYTYKGKPYCNNCLLEKIDKLEKMKHNIDKQLRELYYWRDNK